MSQLLFPRLVTPEVLNLVHEAIPQVPPARVDYLLARVDITTPFIVDSAGLPRAFENSYLRKRRTGKLEDFSLKRLKANSITAFGYDLTYFLNTYQEATPYILAEQAASGDLLEGYVDHLQDKDTELAASTIERRAIVAREFLTDLCTQTNKPGNALSVITHVFEKNFFGDAERPIKYFQTSHLPGTRRRQPSLISILPTKHLITFINSFLDPVHKIIAKLIYSTGLRRSEVASLTVKDVALLSPIYPGGPATITVIGKGDKERKIEIEAPTVAMLRNYLSSRARRDRLKKAAKELIAEPAATPLFLTQGGLPMSGDAIGDAFLRASERCGIKRTPHELRHEFAVNYLLTSYRNLQQSISKDSLDKWLVRLMIDKTSLAVEKLARLLGHSSSETTKSTYLATLISSDPSIREDWNQHLDEIERGLA
ncbi:tyrosine-type recombinase/integrase [Acidovorax sp. BLS4]|uniref:tyrosine-type recombinase/integrase n=1 Tax=Acidovorax sp. BLS4 TaxID=3273430 RepID=UPI002942FCDC|nr:tyrosine-type recombinase/integrase [Paracidovorax avenae]WOI45476.1 tyrosine-type recombinase/integrase [Paracidovorax avenae]